MKNDIRPPFSKRDNATHWVIRLISAVISCAFLLILFLAVTNEDKPHGAAIPVLGLLVLTIVACFAAWRWETVGGVIVIIGALCLSVAAYFASLSFGLGSMSFLPSLIYGVPFLALGILFWLSGKHNNRLNRIG
mgnify:FL=1